MVKDKGLITMPTNEAEVPPRIWIVPDNTNGTFWPKSAWGDPPPILATLEYVPASALAEVWEKAIAAVRAEYNVVPVRFNEQGFHAGIINATAALRVARDEALSVQKENEDEG